MSRLICSVLPCLAFAARLPACGPDFPNSLLCSDEAVLAAPVGNFAAELERIAAPRLPQFRAQLPAGDVVEQTADADLADLHAAISDARVIAEYETVRDALRVYANVLADWKSKQSCKWCQPDKQAALPQPPQLTPPAGLPGEFADYLRGAIAFHQGQLAEARAAWEALLRRPANERHYRSTWAAFMLGKSWLDADPAKAIEWFGRVREIARQGFADSLALAASSLGWQARAELNRERYEEAIELYLAQLTTGDRTAVMSLQWVSGDLLKTDFDRLRRAARRDSVRQMLTAYVVAQGGPFREAPPVELVQTWLRAVEAAGVDNVAGADRLAWSAYQAGQMDIAGRWLQRAPAHSVIAQWVKVKLLLRDGQIDQATKLLARVVRRFPQQELWDGAYTAFDPDTSEHPPAHVAPVQPTGELGALQLARGQYVDALGSLFRAGYWLDAAYVAERVLTVEELSDYVSNSAPDSVEQLRHLLARRLARLGRFAEARKYLPDDLRDKLDAYAGKLQRGHDTSRSSAERAQALWEAAKIARWWGLALLSTELEPDWHCVEANFELGTAAEERQASDQLRLVAARPDELERARASQASVNQRFHYRYTAAALAWEAAQLMPDETDTTAQALCEAGTWLKNRDPKAADRFYKALVRRCGTTALGQEADRLRWFPKISGSS